MNRDGYALIRVHDTDGGKADARDISIFDLRLTDLDPELIVSDLVDQLPDGLKDVLVVCTFTYKSESSYDHWSGATEYEDCFYLVSHEVMKEGYKEFDREQISLEFGVSGGVVEEDVSLYGELVEDWEEFYDDQFKLSTTI